MTPTILLNEELHQYTVDGTVKASVTEILNEWLLVDGWYVNIYRKNSDGTPQRIPQGVFEDAGDFGRAVHKAAKFVVQGKRITIPHEIAHAICELERWMRDYKVDYEVFEMQGYSSKLDVAGTLDLTCTFGNDEKVLHLVDYKTAAHAPTVGPQTWAYEQIYREMVGDNRVIKRHTLYLPKKDGEYKFVELNSNRDEHAFKSANYIYHWRRQ